MHLIIGGVLCLILNESHLFSQVRQGFIALETDPNTALNESHLFSQVRHPHRRLPHTGGLTPSMKVTCSHR